MLDSASFESPVSSAPPPPYRNTTATAHRLVWTGGIANVTLDASARCDLVETDVDRADLRVVRRDDEVRITQAGSFWTRALDALLYGFDPEPRARVSLRSDVDWHVECRGGASELEAHFEDMRLGGLVLRGGVSEAYLRLGPPRGRTTVRISGGVSRLELRRPAHVGLRLWIRGGVSHLTFDAMELESVGGKLALTSDDFDACGDFYDVEISGGASDLVLTAR